MSSIEQTKSPGLTRTLIRRLGTATLAPILALGAVAPAQAGDVKPKLSAVRIKQIEAIADQRALTETPLPYATYLTLNREVVHRESDSVSTYNLPPIHGPLVVNVSAGATDPFKMPADTQDLRDGNFAFLYADPYQARQYHAKFKLVQFNANTVSLVPDYGHKSLTSAAIGQVTFLAFEHSANGDYAKTDLDVAFNAAHRTGADPLGVPLVGHDGSFASIGQITGHLPIGSVARS